MINRFSVSNPCHENWNGMVPKENGRYCTSCQKIVVDFTKKTEQEIIEYISANSGRKMCGTFINSQLNDQIKDQKKEYTIRFLAAVLLVFGMSLFSCQSVDLGDNPNPDPIKFKNCITTGVVVTPDINDPSVPPPVIGQIESGSVEKIPLYEEVITGDIVIPDSLQTMKEDDGNEILSIASVMPEFPGGTAKMMEYIVNNLKYPQSAIDAGIVGTVYVSFVVNKDGTLDTLKILRGINHDCDEEAKRVIENMPRWKPGMQAKKPVNVQYILPIKFIMK
jgi:TonB family protein